MGTNQLAAAIFASVCCALSGASCTLRPDPSTDGSAAFASEAAPESVGEDAEPQLSPFGVCEDICYELYVVQCARCLLLPRDRREPCYAKAAQDLGTCLKRCAGE